MLKKMTKILFIVLVLVVAGCELLGSKTGAPNLPVYQIPVNVYLLQSQSSGLKAHIDAEQMQRVLNQANIIWRQAGIEFYLNEIQPLEAVEQNNYIKLLQPPIKANKKELTTALKATCQIPHYQTHVLNLCVIGFLFNHAGGAYFNDEKPMAMWPTLRHGRLHFNPATLAHEFGHFLDLPHNHLTKWHLMREKSAYRFGRLQIQNFVLTQNEIAHARKLAFRYHKKK